VLTVDPDNKPQWWVDIRYTVYQDTESHMGIYMTIGNERHRHPHARKNLIQKVQQRLNWWESTTRWVNSLSLPSQTGIFVPIR